MENKKDKIEEKNNPQINNCENLCVFNYSKIEGKIDENDSKHVLQSGERKFRNFIQYNPITYLSSKIRPDIYLSKENMLKGKDYKNSITRPDGTKKMQDVFSDSSVSSISKYDELHNIKKRYYNHQENITIKCSKCGEVGHSQRFCNNLTIPVCFKCNKPGHNAKNCPKIQCFHCNKLGHISKKCPLNNKNSSIKDEIFCSRCKNYGHKKDDCLIYPIGLYVDDISGNEKPLCFFCKSSTHYICPFPNKQFLIKYYDSDEVELSDENDEKIRNLKNQKEEKKNFYQILEYFKKETNRINLLNKKKQKKEAQRIFSQISNEDIQNTIFCYICGDMHDVKDCPSNKVNNNSAPPVSLVPRTNYHIKNPLKYQAIYKEEYKINHHLPFKNYYEDDNSSGESFTDIVQEHVNKYKNKSNNNTNHSNDSKNQNGSTNN